MHGGLFSDDTVTLDDIRKVERNKQPPETGESEIYAAAVLIPSLWMISFHYSNIILAGGCTL